MSRSRLSLREEEGLRGEGWSGIRDKLVRFSVKGTGAKSSWRAVIRARRVSRMQRGSTNESSMHDFSTSALHYPVNGSEFVYRPHKSPSV